MGDIFQEDLKKSEWSELQDHANIPLIGMPPWGIIAGQQSLAGIHVRQSLFFQILQFIVSLGPCVTFLSKVGLK